MSSVTSEILSNKTAFEVFFKENYDGLCRFAFTFTKDADDAEEIVQNCFVKLWEDRKTLVIGNSPKAYLFTMIRNSSLNQIKHISIREEYKAHNERNLQQVTLEDADSETSDLQEKVNQAIENMPPQRKRIFEMSRFEGLKYKEIAAHLNISVKTVENHMGSAIKYLRIELKDYMHFALVIYLLTGLGVNVKSIVLLLVS